MTSIMRKHKKTIKMEKLSTLLSKQKNTCCYCGCKIHHPYLNIMPIATIDHVIPLSKGGSNLMHNLVACCQKCNTLKASRDLGPFLVDCIQRRDELLKGGKL